MYKKLNNFHNNFKVAIIGPYPPPYGGISIHIQRMHYFLMERNIEHTIYTNKDFKKENLVNISKKKMWLLKYFFSAKENILHFHNIDWRSRVLIGLMRFTGKKVILTIHGASLHRQINQSGWLKKKLLIWALKNINSIIVVDPKIKNLLVSLGIISERVEYIPTFIPPIIKDEDIAEIPLKIWDFIDTHKPIILANASTLVFYDNIDLYGLDMCIDLCAKLREYYPTLGFIFCLPDIGDYEYFNKMDQKIKEKKLEHNFIFQTQPCQLYPIIMKSDVFVRPTNTDGYGVSIAEAIHFTVPSVASNVCQRPGGTILFNSRDLNDFRLKVKELLENYEFHKKQIENIELDNYAKDILDIYTKITGGE